MVARPSADGKRAEFDLVDVSGGTEHGHMDHAVFSIIDANHPTEDWTYMTARGQAGPCAHGPQADAVAKYLGNDNLGLSWTVSGTTISRFTAAARSRGRDDPSCLALATFQLQTSCHGLTRISRINHE